MSAPRVDMHRLQELVRLYRAKTGVRERSQMLRMSTRTEREYRGAIDAAGLLEGDVDELPSLEELKEAVQAAKPVAEPRTVVSTVDPWRDEIEKLEKSGAGPTAIWDKLNRKHDEFTASVSAVKRAVRRIRRNRGPDESDVAIPVVSKAGEVAQVDFGYAGMLKDPVTGKMRRAWVFVMVLAYSRHMFAELVFDQRASTWIRLHVRAFRYFCGVPLTIVPDNLKAAVVRCAFGVAEREKLALNRSYRELGRHYGCRIDPSPPYRPETKGKVESGVKYVKNNFMATCSAESLDEANDDLRDWLERTAGRRIHGTTGRRPLEAFEEEKPALMSLPTAPYEIVIWHRGKVHRDSHVLFDGRLYSVPWQHLGQHAWVRATPASVTVFVDDARGVPQHPRTGLCHPPDPR